MGAQYETSGRTVCCDGGTDRDLLAAVREHAPAIREHVASGEDDLAAFARLVLAAATGEDPDPADALQAGLLGGTGGSYRSSWDDSTSFLAQYADELAEAAEAEENPEAAAAYAALSAVAEGETPPAGAVKQVREQSGQRRE